MKTGELWFKRQGGNYGYFGFVKLEIKLSLEDEIVGADPDDLANPGKNAYTSAVIFGIHYGLKEYRRKTGDRKRFRVNVLRSQMIPVDSSPTLQAYVAARAVLNAFGIDDDNSWPLLKAEEALIVFRK